jgi:hypothetical protein
MFGPSLKSVPGCLVSIVPRLIGVPVALTPGLGPQEEVLTFAELELLEVLLALLELDPAAGAELLVELLLLPQPASSATAAAAATA